MLSTLNVVPDNTVPLSATRAAFVAAALGNGCALYECVSCGDLSKPPVCLKSLKTHAQLSPPDIEGNVPRV
jgi:hypothetical protein